MKLQRTVCERQGDGCAKVRMAGPQRVTSRERGGGEAICPPGSHKEPVQKHMEEEMG